VVLEVERQSVLQYVAIGQKLCVKNMRQNMRQTGLVL
jgi:hypothetical protein